jgi:hypothetical protein
MTVNRGSYPKEVLERTYVYSSKKYGYVVERVKERYTDDYYVLKCGEDEIEIKEIEDVISEIGKRYGDKVAKRARRDLAKEIFAVNCLRFRSYTRFKFEWWDRFGYVGIGNTELYRDEGEYLSRYLTASKRLLTDEEMEIIWKNLLLERGVEVSKT